MLCFWVLFFVFLVKSDAESIVTDDCLTNSFFSAATKCHSSDYCFTLDQDKSQIVQFSTKTAYQLDAANQSDFGVENCSPAKIWLLIRHGTRLPTAKGIRRLSDIENIRDEMIENANKMGRAPLCAEDWEMLKNWKWNNSIEESQANDLVSQGYKELTSIATNFQKYFPNLFESLYTVNNYHFRHTNTERTRASFRAFADALFGEKSYEKIDAEAPPNHPDLLLKAYANCRLWKEQKTLLKQTNSEAIKFQNSDVYQKLVADINARFGFNGTLSADKIRDIFDMCRYQQAWQTNKASVWCSLFTPSQVRTLEYREDLMYFYKSSHGSKLNKNVKCSAVKDMLKRLGNDDEPKTTVYFSHSAALQLFLTSLGALRDETDLTADNFAEMSIRKWKTSKISPFAANIAIVRYQCPTDDKVRLFLNEKPLHIDWCNSNGVCDWKDMEEKYAFYANENCDQIFCRKE